MGFGSVLGQLFSQSGGFFQQWSVPRIKQLGISLDLEAKNRRKLYCAFTNLKFMIQPTWLEVQSSKGPNLMATSISLGQLFFLSEEDESRVVPSTSSASRSICDFERRYLSKLTSSREPILSLAAKRFRQFSDLINGVGSKNQEIGQERSKMKDNPKLIVDTQFQFVKDMSSSLNCRYTLEVSCIGLLSCN